MSRKIAYVANVTITISEPGGDMPGFLDMLRYDRCEVTAWRRAETVASKRGHTFVVTLVRRDNPFTIDRWHSFGLRLNDMSEERYG